MTGPDLRNTNLPRGLRNNNPFNLVKTSISWQGKVIGSDPRFETFQNLGFGIRAGLLDLYNDWARKNLKTIKSLITEFAPPSENLTGNYINFVSARTGIAPDRPLQLPDLVKVAQAIVILENGQVPQTEQAAAMVPAVAVQLPQYGEAAKPGVNVPLLAALALIASGL